MQITREIAVASADRAANAAGNFSNKPGRTWLNEIAAGGRLDDAAAFVRAHPDAPAEAVFLAVRREDIAWRDLQAQKRVAVEVFRATLLVCDKMIDDPAPRLVPRMRGHLDAPAIERDATISARIWDGGE